MTSLEKYMADLKKIHKEIEAIKFRNKRVEADKAWETSWTRRAIIVILTYFVIVTFFYAANLPDPFENAVVPSVAFLLSTASLPYIKKWWLKKRGL